MPDADELAQVITAEMGSPILFSHFAQVGASAMVLDYFVGLTRTYPFEEVRPGFLGPALVRREPVGVCAGIIPWNVPLFITMLKLAPALASGSTLVLKPAPETPIDAFILAEIAASAGLPARRSQRRSRRPRGRRASGHGAGRRQGELHGLDPRRASDRRPLRRAAAALHPRTRR
jgi:acyl-CoA reductase-like NAD-dependent aldehyde dehydrogenase